MVWKLRAQTSEASTRRWWRYDHTVSVSHLTLDADVTYLCLLYRIEYLFHHGGAFLVQSIQYYEKHDNLETRPNDDQKSIRSRSEIDHKIA
jgi:hypothetical protein